MAAKKAEPTIKWSSPGPVASAFMKSKAFVKGIRGPVGSGKSVTCCMELWRRCAAQKPDAGGVRRARAAVIRNTNPELKTTTIKTWTEWFRPERFGDVKMSPPYTHHMRVPLPDNTVLDLEVIFLALDRDEDVKKLLSLELTIVFINEARELSKAIVDACTMRVGRYPRAEFLVEPGVIMDTNAPSDDHWWPIMAGEAPPPEWMGQDERMMLVKPQDWQFFVQPGGMMEILDEHGSLQGYQANPKAENTQNLWGDYYGKIIKGKSRTWIKVYVLNRLASLFDGKPVYAMFKPETHIAPQPLTPWPDAPIFIGIDFGRTPSACFDQLLPGGRCQTFHELVAQDMGAVRFAEVLRHEIQLLGIGEHALRFVGDPTGDYMGQSDDTTPMQMLQAAGIPCRPAETNDPIVRIEAVTSQLNQMVDGRPGYQVSPSCKTLIAGFEGGYQYKKLSVSRGDSYDDKPFKNRFSHVHDARQYAALEMGFGRQVLVGARETRKPTVVKASWNPFEKRAKTKLTGPRGWRR